MGALLRMSVSHDSSVPIDESMYRAHPRVQVSQVAFVSHMQLYARCHLVSVTYDVRYP